MRTTRETVTFDHPFSLYAVDGLQPPGTYEIDIDEDLIEGIVPRLPTCRDHDLSAPPKWRAGLGAGRQG